MFVYDKEGRSSEYFAIPAKMYAPTLAHHSYRPRSGAEKVLTEDLNNRLMYELKRLRVHALAFVCVLVWAHTCFYLQPRLSAWLVPLSTCVCPRLNGFLLVCPCSSPADSLYAGVLSSGHFAEDPSQGAGFPSVQGRFLHW